MAKDEIRGTWEKTKGAVKDKVGEATGNRRLEAEGEAQRAAGRAQVRAARTAPSAIPASLPGKGEIRGAWEKTKGTVKDKLGEATGDRRLEREGEAQRAAGAVQKKVGEARRVAGDALNKLGSKVKGR